MNKLVLVEDDTFGDHIKYIFKVESMCREDIYKGEILYSFLPNRQKGERNRMPSLIFCKDIPIEDIVKYKLLGYI